MDFGKIHGGLINLCVLNCLGLVNLKSAYVSSVLSNDPHFSWNLNIHWNLKGEEFSELTINLLSGLRINFDKSDMIQVRNRGSKTIGFSNGM